MSSRVAQRALFGAQLSKESASGLGVVVDADVDERGVVAVSSRIRKSVRVAGRARSPSNRLRPPPGSGLPRDDWGINPIWIAIQLPARIRYSPTLTAPRIGRYDSDR